jgi:hypothetical protein
VSRYSPTLLTPPPEEEDIYPYRLVWVSLIIESTILFSISVVFFVLYNIFGVFFTDSVSTLLNIALAFLPLLLWLGVSLLGEHRALEPRANLLTVLIVSALAANAIGIPLINDFFGVDAWLSLSTTLDRILGYAFSIGIIQESIKYFVIRYIAWERNFRIREDAVAYAIASSIGFISVLNLHFISTGSPPPNVVILRISATYAIHIAASIIVSYGLSELKFNPSSIMLLPFMLSVATFYTGLAIPLRAGVISAGFFLGEGQQNQLFGTIIPIILLAFPCVIIAFLYSNAERRQQEAVISDEV